MPALASFPLRDALVMQRGVVTPAWRDWLTRVWQRLNAVPVVTLRARQTAQDAAISPAAVLVTLPETGLYRATWYARVSRAATVSSSLQFTLGWTDGGVACTQVGAALTGNTTATHESASVTFLADKGTDVTLAAAYASSGATAMQFDYAVALEQVA